VLRNGLNCHEIGVSIAGRLRFNEEKPIPANVRNITEQNKKESETIPTISPSVLYFRTQSQSSHLYPNQYGWIGSRVKMIVSLYL